MFAVKNGEIYHTRGDTGSLNFSLKDENKKEITGYSAILSVKKKLRDKEYLFQSFYDRDDIYLKAERDVIVVLENGTLLPIDQTSVVIQSSEPEEATVWLQTEG